MYRFRLLAVLAVVFATVTGATLAQTVTLDDLDELLNDLDPAAIALAQAYTVQEGGLTFGHPFNWYAFSGETLDPPGSVILTDSRATANIEGAQDLQPGGMFISLYPPVWIQERFVDFSTDIETVWENILNDFYDGFPVEETMATTVQGNPARMVSVELEGYDFATFLFDIGDEQYVLAAISVAEGEMALREPLIELILGSVAIDPEFAIESDAPLEKDPVPSTNDE
ncbi:MAG: hypothetical protein AAFU54_25195 [Chloroflexota bacterium]